MREDQEIIKAGSLGEATEILASLYPTLTDYQLLSRRDESGRFSKRGHTFLFSVQYEEPDEPAPEDLGEDEY